MFYCVIIDIKTLYTLIISINIKINYLPVDISKKKVFDSTDMFIIFI